MGRTTIEDDFASRGYQYEKTMRKRAKNFLFLEKLAKDTGLERDDLFRFSPQGGAGNQVNQQATATMGEDGKVVPIPEKEVADYDEVKDKVGETEPDTAPPEIPEGVSPINSTNIAVDSIPKQNAGLSRSVEQSYPR
jgi:hypothetical protein